MGRPERHPDYVAVALTGWKGVLEDVRQRLNRNKGDRNREISGDRLRCDLGYDFDAVLVARKRFTCLLRQVLQQRLEIDKALIFEFMENSVHQGEGVDSRARLTQSVLGGGILQLLGLEIEQAHHDLKIVLHAMMDLAQQNAFLRQRFPKASVTVLNGIGHLRKRASEHLELRRRSL